VINFESPLPYLTPLGQKYVDLFAYAQANRKTVMIDKMLLRMAFDGQTYISLSPSTKRRERNSEAAQMVARSPGEIETMTYFTNAMLVEIDGVVTTTTERCVLGDYVAFTFEVDQDDLGFFKRQLDWCMPYNRPERSAIGKLHKQLSEYTDFAGITVVWGGNKSLHIHVVFSALAYKAQHDHPMWPYATLKRLWWQLNDIVVPALGLEPGSAVRTDAAMSSATAYRRTPWAQRILTGPNILGMPIGAAVEQTVLYEQWRDRAGRGAKRSLFNPSTFTDSTRWSNHNSRLNKPDAPLPNRFTNVEMLYINDRLRQIFNSTPRFDRLVYDTSWVAYFYNSARDRTASSYMRESHPSVDAIGTDARLVKNSRHASLPLPLGAMLRLWARKANDDAALVAGAPLVTPDDGDPFFTIPEHRSIEHHLTVRCTNVTDKAELRRMTEGAALDLITAEQISILRATEGAGKTTSLLRSHDKVVGRKRGLAMYAFGDYDNAYEKCDAFNSMGHTHYYGVVWRSFSRAYADACAKLHVTPFTMADVAAANVNSLFELVSKRQANVIDMLKIEHRAMWAAVGDRQLVIFTVHTVAHSWQYMSTTRMMWHPDFWCAGTGAERQAAKPAIREWTKLSVLVHDECSASTFINVISPEQRSWLVTYGEHLTTLLSQNRIGEAYKRFNSLPPFPGGLDFMAVQALLSARGFDRYTTRDTGEFPMQANSDPEKDIYNRAHGCDWFVAERNWWTGIADNVLFLTTEYVPLAVARKAVAGLRSVDLETPNLARDTVDVQLRRMSSAKAPEFVAERQTEAASIGMSPTVITNIAKGNKIISHVAAKGRNDLAAEDVYQCVFFNNPAVYEFWQVLNAYTGRADLVLRSLVDSLNQSCGRNRGFRNMGETMHVLFMPHRLYSILLSMNALVWMRYDLVVLEDAADRKRAKYNA
jgi:hypothetical protein